MNSRILFSLTLLAQAFLGAFMQASVTSIDESIQSIDEKTQFSFLEDQFFIDFSGQIDLWAYHTDPGSLYGFFFPGPGNSTDFSRRLNLFADIYIGENLYGFVKFRWDDGVHPGVGVYYGKTIQSRFDEYYLRWSNEDKSISVQAGQFTPLYGTFLRRQNTWDMGLISYPYVYEGVTSVSDSYPPYNAAHFTSLANQPNNPLVWLPVVWAPLYPKGISIFGSKEKWEYAFSVVNAAPSSRGLTWNNNDFGHETYMARLAYEVSPGHEIGTNFTHGPYFQPYYQSLLPAGTTVDDYNQTNLSFDYSYSGRRLKLWAEAFIARFEVPNVSEDAVVYSYYIEGQYDLSAAWWLVGRWNHEFYNDIDVNGTSTEWDNRIYRIDLGFGFRPMRHFQIKAQYSYKEEDGPFQNGTHLYLIETTLKF